MPLKFANQLNRPLLAFLLAFSSLVSEQESTADQMDHVQAGLPLLDDLPEVLDWNSVDAGVVNIGSEGIGRHSEKASARKESNGGLRQQARGQSTLSTNEEE